MWALLLVLQLSLLPGRANGCGTSLFCHLEIVIYFVLGKSLTLHFPFLLFYLL